MDKFTEESKNGKAAPLGSLDDLIQRGAWQIIQQAIEAEMATLLEQHENVKTLGGI
jgi:putative transposase